MIATRFRQLLAFTAALVVTAGTFLAPAGHALAQEDALEPGQQVNLSVAGVPGEEVAIVSKKYTISGKGTLNLPYVQEISVAGMTRSQAEKKIEQAYKAGEIYTNPTITILVDAGDTTTRFITVAGEVNRQGQVPFRVGLRLLEACAAAGGFSDFADPSRIRLIRDGKTTVYNLKNISENTNVNVVLKPNDNVIVPQKKAFGGFGFGD